MSTLECIRPKEVMLMESPTNSFLLGIDRSLQWPHQGAHQGAHQRASYRIRKIAVLLVAGVATGVAGWMPFSEARASQDPPARNGGGSASKPPAASEQKPSSASTVSTPAAKQEKTQESSSRPQTDSRPTTPKSLDDLLGVPDTGAGGDAASADDAARREQEKRLERSLDEASMQDLVRQALDGMKTASERLGEKGDAGLGTQRVQDEVVKTLQRLLEEAQKQQRQSSSSSSSSSSSRSGSRSADSQGQQGKSGDPKERNGQDRASAKQRSQGARSDASSTSGDSQGEPGSRDNEAIAEAGELSESRVEWGQLPERVRELVLQGRRDRVSTVYERLTREYYRRLAEEASK